MRWVFEGFVNAPPQGKGRFLLKVKGLRTPEALRMFRKSYTMGFDSGHKPIRNSKLNSRLHCLGYSGVKTACPCYHFSGAQPCLFATYVAQAHHIYPTSSSLHHASERQMNQQQVPSQRSPDVASPKADGINGFLSLDVLYKMIR